MVSNLVGEFIAMLGNSAQVMSKTLARWNQMPAAEAESEILACCGSRKWARGLARRRPLRMKRPCCARPMKFGAAYASQIGWRRFVAILESMGEPRSEQPVNQRSAAWSAHEQGNVSAGSGDLKIALGEANREYERRFGHIFIVCATGKSGAEILQILQRRIRNDSAAELREAADSSGEITYIRLKRWLAE